MVASFLSLTRVSVSNLPRDRSLATLSISAVKVAHGKYFIKETFHNWKRVSNKQRDQIFKPGAHLVS